MSGRGLRHYRKESPQSRDENHVNKGARRALSRDPSPITNPPAVRLGLEGPPNVMGLHGLQNPASGVEQKLAPQHAEMQRLIGENQRLSVTHVALRQELAAAQQEIVRVQQSRQANDTEKEQRLNITQVALRQELAESKQEVKRLQEALAAMHAEKEQHLRATTEKFARMEAELKATEFLKSDFERLRFEREELAVRFEHLSGEIKRLPVKDQEIASLRIEVDELLRRHQQARMDFEQQKKLNLQHLEQQQTMERNTFAMTREIEKLRAELANADRKQQAYLSASSGGMATQGFQKSLQSVGVYENSYGTPQEPSKGSSSEIKPTGITGKYEASDGLLGKPPSANGDAVGDWSKHDAPNGRSFYYNLATGVTQWDKPSTMTAGTDANAMHQRQIQRVPGTATKELTPEVNALPAHTQQKATLPQLKSAQQPVSPATSQAAQHIPPSNSGISLSVLGLSEGISDRDLASIFHPYGVILYAKVTVDTKSGTPQFNGIVTMENAKAAEAAAAAVNGMLILGRRIKVEIQRREQTPTHQEGHPHHRAPERVMQGVGPMRSHHHRAGASAAHWPY